MSSFTAGINLQSVSLLDKENTLLTLLKCLWLLVKTMIGGMKTVQKCLSHVLHFTGGLLRLFKLSQTVERLLQSTIL